MLVPLDLKRCPTPVIVLDEQKSELSNVTITTSTTTHHVWPASLHKVGGAVSHDVCRKGRLTELHKHNSTMQRAGGVAATVSSDHVTQAMRTQLKLNSSVTGNHLATSLGRHGTNALHRKSFEGGCLTLIKETPKASSCTNNKGQNSQKRTWNEDAGDDDEFDELCNMVDLSFDGDVVTDDQVTKVMTPDNNSRSDDQNVHHTVSTTVGSTQSWSCPMCNEQFVGRSVWMCKIHVRIVQYFYGHECQMVHNELFFQVHYICDYKNVILRILVFQLTKVLDCMPIRTVWSES